MELKRRIDWAYARSNGRFSHARAYAKKRGIEWAIEKDLYDELTKRDCAYCDGKLPPAGTGLDRKDNRFGYVPENVVPCCHQCNMAKSDFFTYDEMMATLGPAIKYIRKCRSERM